jgi:hypothetical protein
VDDDSHARSGRTIVMVGCVTEVHTESGLSSLSMTSVFGSQEWSFMIPANLIIPEVGRMIAISFHETDSGLVLDDLQVL